MPAQKIARHGLGSFTMPGRLTGRRVTFSNPALLLPGTAHVACSGNPGWPIVNLGFFAAGPGGIHGKRVRPPHVVFRKRGEGKLCKAQCSVRNAISRRASARATGIVAIARDWKAFASAWMGSTIVRTAGKHAKFTWWIRMTGDPVRVKFHLDQDSALVGVLCRAVQFQASQAGFESEACVEIARASEGVCRESLLQLAGADDGLDVMLESFADRIEVSFVHGGQMAPAVGMEKFALPDDFARGTGGINGLELLSRVDRVLYNTEDGKVRTTLVKFLKPRG
jgi:hypothetical protein